MPDKRTIKGRTPVITPPDRWGWCCIVSEENGDEILTRNGNWRFPPAPWEDTFFYATPERCEAFVAGLSAPPEGPRIVAWGATSRHIEIEWDGERIEIQRGARGRWLDIGQGRCSDG